MAETPILVSDTDIENAQKEWLTEQLVRRSIDTYSGLCEAGLVGRGIINSTNWEHFQKKYSSHQHPVPFEFTEKIYGQIPSLKPFSVQDLYDFWVVSLCDISRISPLDESQAQEDEAEIDNYMHFIGSRCRQSVGWVILNSFFYTNSQKAFYKNRPEIVAMTESVRQRFEEINALKRDPSEVTQLIDELLTAFQLTEDIKESQDERDGLYLFKYMAEWNRAGYFYKRLDTALKHPGKTPQNRLQLMSSINFLINTVHTQSTIALDALNEQDDPGIMTAVCLGNIDEIDITPLLLSRATPAARELYMRQRRATPLSAGPLPSFSSREFQTHMAQSINTLFDRNNIASPIMASLVRTVMARLGAEYMELYGADKGLEMMQFIETHLRRKYEQMLNLQLHDRAYLFFKDREQSSGRFEKSEPVTDITIEDCASAAEEHKQIVAHVRKMVGEIESFRSISDIKLFSYGSMVTESKEPNAESDMDILLVCSFSGFTPDSIASLLPATRHLADTMKPYKKCTFTIKGAQFLPVKEVQITILNTDGFRTLMNASETGNRKEIIESLRSIIGIDTYGNQKPDIEGQARKPYPEEFFSLIKTIPDCMEELEDKTKTKAVPNLASVLTGNAPAEIVDRAKEYQDKSLSYERRKLALNGVILYLVDNLDYSDSKKVRSFVSSYGLGLNWLQAAMITAIEEYVSSKEATPETPEFGQLKEFVKSNQRAVDYSVIAGNNRVVAFGEIHISDNTKTELHDNLKEFKKLGFTHLGLEFLTNDTRELLVTYQKLAVGDPQKDPLRQKLLENLRNFEYTPRQPYLTMDLIDAAIAEGLTVVPLDSPEARAQRDNGDLYARDKEMASQIETILKADEKSKVFFIAGIKHTMHSLNSTTTLLERRGVPTTAVTFVGDRLPDRTYTGDFEKAARDLFIANKRFMVPKTPELHGDPGSMNFIESQAEEWLTHRTAGADWTIHLPQF